VISTSYSQKSSGLGSLIIENVRCFYGRNQVQVRPFTILVGENSTGKSTFLSLLRIVWDLCQEDTRLNFNEEPFNLGAFDNIVSNRGNRKHVSFSIGLSCDLTPKQASSIPNLSGRSVTIQGSFGKQKSQPVVTSLSVEAEPYRVLYEDAGPNSPSQLTASSPSSTFTLTPAPSMRLWGYGLFEFLPSYLEQPKSQAREAPTVAGKFPPEAELEALDILLEASQYMQGRRPFAFAPIRSRPRRTYDPLRDEPAPEGLHVPMLLATMSASKSGDWDALRSKLSQFGVASGLFTSVEVRRLGDESDPFQLRFKVARRAHNIVDVGYGVSQILPILVDCLRGRARSAFLLQEPEVHLHPRAQAELASLLAGLCMEQEKRFFVETHSDHFIDRVRLEVRSGRLSAENVMLLYFDRKPSGRVAIHPIELDRFGNLIRVPRRYRDFFLNEEARMLGGP
jgi:hypothetical protein